MKRLTTGLALGVGAGLLGAAGALAGPELIDFPESYTDKFVHYNSIDRPDRKTVRFFYVNPEALEQAEPGEDLPHGTVLIMEDHKATLDADDEPVRDDDSRFVPSDEITNIFVMEKQPGWGAEYPPEKRNGEWEYAWFLPDGSAKADAQFDGCFACHLHRAERDFTFTFYKYVLDTKP